MSKQYEVVIIGGGVTGIGILRDLSMRGIRALLLEQRDLAHGTSSRFHGLLHSGARYAVGDPEAGAECISENRILRKIAAYAIESVGGMFVRTAKDDETYETNWLAACQKVGITTENISVKKALEMEPNLDPNIKSAYKVPDGAIDGFRLVWHNAGSARRYGGELRTYAKVQEIHSNNGIISGLTYIDTLTGQTERVETALVINAAGSWCGEVAKLAGLEVNVKPDRGLLLAFNHRFCDSIINRLRKSSDGDIFVPHGSITIFGTSSVSVENPADFTVSSLECLKLLDIGRELFPDINDYRILRGFAGTRPLYTPAGGSGGRNATREFTIIDHTIEGMNGMITVTGGKLTTYRLMAEKTSDLAASKFGNTKVCRTADEPLIAEVSPELKTRAKKVLPTVGVELSIERQGAELENIVRRIEKNPAESVLLCECELVTQAEFAEIALESTSRRLSDVRRRTRMGMGTCQGNFCAFRGVGAVTKAGLMADLPPSELLKTFMEERWHGIRPMLWGTQMREVELSRAIYGSLLNVDGEVYTNE